MEKITRATALISRTNGSGVKELEEPNLTVLMEGEILWRDGSVKSMPSTTKVLKSMEIYTRYGPPTTSPTATMLLDSEGEPRVLTQTIALQLTVLSRLIRYRIKRIF